MKEIILKSVHMENFKTFKDVTIEFGEKVTSIFAMNFRGKSSVADAFSWVMFNKSSTGNTEGSQFHPRRYDENGVNIDHVDVVAEIVLLVDGSEMKIRKVQRQDWVRHRGDDFDTYEGDKQSYEWNDVPTTATDHKKKVAEIISEDVFLLLTNPAAFPSKPAKAQREFLLKNIANITDDDVFDSDSEFDELKKAMGKLSVTELQAKNKKELSKYKKKQEEIPVRIDQESKRIEDVDFSEKEKELEELQSRYAKVDEEMANNAKAYEEVNSLLLNKERLKTELLQISNNLKETWEKARRELEDKVDGAKRVFNDYFRESKNLSEQVELDRKSLEEKEKSLADMREQYKAEMSKEMDETTLICPTCGQDLPDAEKDKIRTEFSTKKKKTLESLGDRGNQLSADIKNLKESIEKNEKHIEELKEQKVDAQKQEKEAQEKLDAYPTTYDPKSDKEYLDKEIEIQSLDERINSINNSDADERKEKLENERAEIQSKIDEVKKHLALKDVIEKSKEEVAKLETELVQTTQNLADCERLDSLIERFTVAKMNMLSERINGKFKYVKWKLFHKQKNGGYEQVCVCMIHGSQYGENTTSATERMMAGMDIINTLQEIYDVKAPIFLDDADLYNEQNIPDMECQLIKLCVSEDEDLRIEVK